MDKALILEKARPAVRPVEVPELGETQYVRVMTGRQRDTFERMIGNREKGDADNLRATVAAWTWCDKDGDRIFTDREVETVANLDSRVLHRIFDGAVAASALTAEEIEAVEGN